MGCFHPLWNFVDGCQFGESRYRPNDDYDDDNFTVEVVDSDGNSEDIVFLLTINPVEDDPRIYQRMATKVGSLGIQSLLVSMKILTLKSMFTPRKLTDN